MTTTVRVAAQVVTATLPWGRAVTVTVQADPLAAVKAAGDLAAQAGARRVTLVLGPDQLQLRRLEGLPPVSRAALRRIVARQALRYFRPAAGGLVTDAAWSGRSSPRRAVLAAADGDLVMAMVAALEEVGVAVDRVRPAESEVSRLDLMPAALRARFRRREWRRVAALGALLITLWSGWGGWSLWLTYRLERWTTRRTAEIAAAVASVKAARREVERAGLAVATLDSMRRERGAVLGVLAQVVDHLPSSAFLTAVAIAADSVALAGRAQSPAELVARFATGPWARVPVLLPPRARSGVDLDGLAAFEVVARRKIR